MKENDNLGRDLMRYDQNIIPFPTRRDKQARRIDIMQSTTGQQVSIRALTDVDRVSAKLFELVGLASDMRMAWEGQKLDFFRFQFNRAMEFADEVQFDLGTNRINAALHEIMLCKHSEVLGKLGLFECAIESQIEALANETIGR